MATDAASPFSSIGLLVVAWRLLTELASPTPPYQLDDDRQLGVLAPSG